jgi:hypothetical protein
MTDFQISIQEFISEFWQSHIATFGTEENQTTSK